MRTVHHHARSGRAAALRLAWALVTLLGAGAVWAQPCVADLTGVPATICGGVAMDALEVERTNSDADHGASGTTRTGDERSMINRGTCIARWTTRTKALNTFWHNTCLS